MSMLIDFSILFTVIAVIPIFMMMIFNSGSGDFWDEYKSAGIGSLAIFGGVALIGWVVYCIFEVFGALIS